MTINSICKCSTMEFIGYLYMSRVTLPLLQLGQYMPFTQENGSTVVHDMLLCFWLTLEYKHMCLRSNLSGMSHRRPSSQGIPWIINPCLESALFKGRSRGMGWLKVCLWNSCAGQPFIPVHPVSMHTGIYLKTKHSIKK